MHESTMHFEPWWQQALTGSAGLRLMILAAVLLIAICLCLRVLWQLPRRRPSAHDAQSGTATIEFALVFPILLFLTLTLIQTTLLFGGQLIVHYAAFAATRSAIVQIPADYGEYEPPNVMIYSDFVGGKYNRIRQAAIVAVLPISGSQSEETDSVGQQVTDSLVEGMQEYYESQGVSTPNWVSRLLPARLRYAADDQNTQIRIFHTEVENPGEVRFIEPGPGADALFGPREAISVEVHHQFSLTIPIVREIFADGSTGSGNNEGRYTEVIARYTLTNEGIGQSLPQPPTLDRRP